MEEQEEQEQCYTPDAVWAKIQENKKNEKEKQRKDIQTRLKEEMAEVNAVFMKYVKALTKTTQNRFVISEEETGVNRQDLHTCVEAIIEHLNSLGEKCTYRIMTFRTTKDEYELMVEVDETPLGDE